MNKVRALLFLGVWIAVLPCLGFPASWKAVLTTLSGVGLIFVSFMFYKESRIKKIAENKEKTFDNFSENNFEGEKEKN